jgi:UDP-3-O-[3-hydroxymyristoyl] glucosamine N-acyltransferase
VKLRELAARLDCELRGDGEVEVGGVAGLEQAGPGDLTFLANPRYAPHLAATRATAVIVAPGHEAPLPCLLADNPYLAFARAVALLRPPARLPPGVHPSAQVDPTAVLGHGVHVGALAVVGPGVRLGARSRVHPHVVLYEGVEVGEDCVLHSGVQVRESCRLGNRVVVQNGAVIGGDGFGFARDGDGRYHKFPQVGIVVIEDDVEIGAQSAIDRPAVGETRVGQGTKIDNLVQVAHGVRIGRHVLLAAQVGIAGSTTLEDHVIMAGQSGATGHVRLARGAVVGAKSAVTKDVDAGQHVTGIPAADVSEWRELVVLTRRLPELRRTVAALEARLAGIEARLRST